MGRNSPEQRAATRARQQRRDDIRQGTGGTAPAVTTTTTGPAAPPPIITPPANDPFRGALEAVLPYLSSSDAASQAALYGLNVPAPLYGSVGTGMAANADVSGMARANFVRPTGEYKLGTPTSGGIEKVAGPGFAPGEPAPGHPGPHTHPGVPKRAISGLPGAPAPIYDPNEMTGTERNQWLSQDRASKALAALANAGTGSGAMFLKNVIGLLQKYGGAGGEGMSRTNYSEMTTQLQNLLAGAKGQPGMEPWANLAQQFLGPSFATKDLMTQTKNVGYGAANKRLFG